VETAGAADLSCFRHKVGDHLNMNKSSNYLVIALFAGLTAMSQASFTLTTDSSSFQYTAVRNSLGWGLDPSDNESSNVDFISIGGWRRTQGPAGGDNGTVSNFGNDLPFYGDFAQGQELYFMATDAGAPVRVQFRPIDFSRFPLSRRLGVQLQPKAYGEYTAYIRALDRYEVWSEWQSVTHTSGNAADGSALFLGLETTDGEPDIFAIEFYVESVNPTDNPPRIAYGNVRYDAVIPVPEPFSMLGMAVGSALLFFGRPKKR
jgi:hypothetical protein